MGTSRSRSRNTTLNAQPAWTFSSPKRNRRATKFVPAKSGSKELSKCSRDCSKDPPPATMKNKRLRIESCSCSYSYSVRRHFSQHGYEQEQEQEHDVEYAGGLDVLVAKAKSTRDQIRPGKERLQRIVRMLIVLLKRPSTRDYEKQNASGLSPIPAPAPAPARAPIPVGGTVRRMGTSMSMSRSSSMTKRLRPEC